MSDPAAHLTSPLWVRPILEDFEGRGYFDEAELFIRLGGALREKEAADPTERKAAAAEFEGFGFRPADATEPGGRRTHFGTGPVGEPDLTGFDGETLAYWRRRMGESKHPILRARYADLLWDLSRPLGFRQPIDAAQIAADSYAEFGPLAHGQHAMTALRRLQRGLQIAVMIKDERRVERLRDALFALFARVNRTWGWVNLFDTFLHFDKVQLTEGHWDAITAGLEAHVTDVDGRPDGAQPSETLHVATRLARRYHHLGRPDDVRRVILASGLAVERAAAAAPSAALGHAWLDDVHRIYRAHGMDEDASRVLLASRARGAEAEAQMLRITTSLEIDPEELRQFCDDTTDGGLEAALHRIVGHFLPDLDRLRELLQEQRRTHPLLSMFGVTQVREGQVVGRSGPVDVDPEGALVHALSQDVGFRAFFLAFAIDRAVERYSITADALLAFLYESPVFSSKFQGLIKQGLEAYLQGDHVKAVSAFVPQIENALRNYLYLIGVPPNKARRGDPGAMTEKSLTDILEHEPALPERFGEGVVLYFRTFLADPRGHNVRNRMAHGLMAAEDFNRGISDRVLHILLLLGTIRRVAAAEVQPREDAERPA